MIAVQISIIVVVLVAIGVASFLIYKRYKNNLVELDCKFYLAENIDELLDNYKRETGVVIDGILGNDFMVRKGYIIDYEHLIVKHRMVKISIKDAVEITEMPLIVLWQNFKKYIFILDTGATASLIHNRCIDTLDYTEHCGDDAKVYGFGGNDKLSKTIEVKLFYSKTRQTK